MAKKIRKKGKASGEFRKSERAQSTPESRLERRYLKEMQPFFDNYKTDARATDVKKAKINIGIAAKKIAFLTYGSSMSEEEERKLDIILSELPPGKIKDYFVELYHQAKEVHNSYSDRKNTLDKRIQAIILKERKKKLRQAKVFGTLERYDPRPSTKRSLGAMAEAHNARVSPGRNYDT